MAANDFPRDRDRPWRRPRRPLRRWALAAAIGTVIVGYAWIVGSMPPMTTDALVSVLIPGVILAAITAWWPPRRIAAPDKLDITGMSLWVICIAALFEWEASAYRDNSLPWHPSLTDLINPLLGPHLLRSAAIVAWLLAGWALVRR